MRWSKTFIPTLKEIPAEAEVSSHQLLLRAGLVRKLSGGLYTFLPLGLRVLQKIEGIVREEMNRAGALEVLMPALQPPEIWQQSGRYETARDVLFKVTDRTKKEWLLGPTHEEVITSLVANEINSYRHLPKTFYQIQTKFRDEIRPRFGLMRAKEFIMKDAYSFDTNDEASQASYQSMYDAYVRIFKRSGLTTLPVEADTGVMGGKFSHEFMVPAETGENEMVLCPGGDYAANIEKAVGHCKPFTPASHGRAALETFPTPGVKTIDDLTRDPFGIAAVLQIKTLVYLAKSKPAIVLIRGDHQLNESKLAVALEAPNLRPARPDEIQTILGAHPGSLGAVGVASVAVYADDILRGAEGMVTGANRDGYHHRHVSMERDIQVAKWADLRTVQQGDQCVRCNRPLEFHRAIEVGHVFKLGTKYSEALGARFLNEQGVQMPIVMGSYGIGITRTLQAIIEQCQDKDGILWPMAVAPYSICITPLNVAPDGPVMPLAESLYNQLTAQGLDVILDDREERPGVKFKDSELIGFPIRIGVGEKSLARGEVEIKPRRGDMRCLKSEDAVAKVLELCKSMA